MPSASRGKKEPKAAAAGKPTGAVVGLGYVGLPLLAEIAGAGYRALGIDISEARVEDIRAGRSYIADISSEAIARGRADGSIDATTDYARVREADFVSICVPTPLRKTKDPDLSFIIEATQRIAPHLKKGAAVILESTTYPGTTEELVRPRLEAAGLKVGEDVFLAFSPERVDPGNRVYHTRNTPKVLGGSTPACLAKAQEFYARIFETVVPVSSTRAAEMVKLLENTFRMVNIGLVNETAIMCERLGIDVWEVIDAARTKPFGFMPFYPGPGLGGHCIPIDPVYLSWKLRSLNYTARFIDLAGEINGGMPAYVVGRVLRALSQRGVAMKGAKVLVLGVAYKRDVSDTRESPAIDVLHELHELGAKPMYHDPHVPYFDEAGIVLESRKLTPALVRGADAVIVVTDHTGVDYGMVAKEAKYVFDARNAVPKGAGAGKVERL